MSNKRRLVAIIAPIAIIACLSGIFVPLLWRSNITRATFFRLKNGMTPAQVEELFGEAPEPWVYGGSHRPGEIPLMWTGEGTAFLMFMEKQGLVMKYWLEDGFSSDTKTIFGGIVIGVPEREVTQIFGRPPDWPLLRTNHGADAKQTLTWRDIDGRCDIIFERGTVVAKYWLGGSAKRREDVLISRFRRLIHLD